MYVRVIDVRLCFCVTWTSWPSFVAPVWHTLHIQHLGTRNCLNHRQFAMHPGLQQLVFVHSFPSRFAINVFFWGGVGSKRCVLKDPFFFLPWSFLMFLGRFADSNFLSQGVVEISEVLGDSDEILAKTGMEFIGREWETWPHVMSRWLLRDFDGVKERNGVWTWQNLTLANYKILDGDFWVGQPHKSLFRLGCHFRDVVRVSFCNLFFFRYVFLIG